MLKFCWCTFVYIAIGSWLLLIYRQNSEIFRLKTGAFRSALKRRAEFGWSFSAVLHKGSNIACNIILLPIYTCTVVILNGPHNIEEQKTEEGPTVDLRGWWFSQKVPNCPDDYGLAHTISHIKDILIEQVSFYQQLHSYTSMTSVAAQLNIVTIPGSFRRCVWIQSRCRLCRIAMSRSTSIRYEPSCPVAEVSTHSWLLLLLQAI